MKYLLDKIPVLEGIFCVGNSGIFLFTSRDTGYSGNLIKGIFSNFLKGI